MRLVDRYILKHIIAGYVFIIFLFGLLFIMADLFTNLTDILKAKTPLFLLSRYYLYTLPLIFKWVSPYSLLIATLHTFAELNRNNEIVSIRMAGISLWRIGWPIIYLSLLISCFSLFIQENVLLPFQKKAEEIKLSAIKKNAPAQGNEKDLAFSSANLIVFARQFLSKERALKGVTIFKENERGEIVAKIISANIIYEKEKWIAKEAIEYPLEANAKIKDKPNLYQNLTLPIKEKPQELTFKKKAFLELSPLKTIRYEIKRLKKIRAYDKLSKFIIEYHQKIVEPFSHLFLILGALPFVLQIRKRHPGLSALGLGFFLGFFYYCFFYLTVALGKTGFLLPHLACWTTPIFFAVMGIGGLFFTK